MKVRRMDMPSASFMVTEADSNGRCRIYLYENFSSVTVSAPEGEEDRTEWEGNEYILTRKWYPKLETDIENNLESWMQAGREQEKLETEIDLYQLKADTDFCMAMHGIVR